MDEWINFYEPFFPSRIDTQNFVVPLETLGHGEPRHRAKIMMHQTQRLVALADDISTIRPERESLQLLFLLICAEHIAKLSDNFEGEGRSKAYVHKFFDEFICDADRQSIERSFIDESFSALSLREVVDLLYSVRCDVVHEGHYWGFQFHDGRTRMITGNPPVIVSMQFDELRSIVIRGCIYAVTNYVDPRPQI